MDQLKTANNLPPLPVDGQIPTPGASPNTATNPDAATTTQPAATTPAQPASPAPSGLPQLPAAGASQSPTENPDQVSDSSGSGDKKLNRLLIFAMVLFLGSIVAFLFILISSTNSNNSNTAGDTTQQGSASQQQSDNSDSFTSGINDGTSSEGGQTDSETQAESDVNESEIISILPADQPIVGDTTGDNADDPNQVGSAVKEFTLEAFNFGYSMDSIIVESGDIVQITLNSTSGSHDWVVDEIRGAKTEVVNSGKSTTIEFEIPKDVKGTFEFYCSVGTHRAQGMVGKLIIQ